jgi:transcriptional regulator GlxA family with amidase domain
MDPRVARIIKWMETGIEADVSVADLAARVQLSSARLTTLFHRGVGTSPGRYLRRLRLERARVLLERTSLTVKEVMTFVGIHDPSHFTRDFSRHHGVAPTRLPQRSWAADADRSRGDRSRHK